MDLQLVLPSVGIFLTIMFAAGGMILMARSYATKRIRDRLEGAILVRDGVDEGVEAIILRDMQLSTVPFLNAILSEARWAQKLDRLLVQAGIPLRLGTFIAIMLLLSSIGAFATISIAHMPLLALPAGAFAGLLPILWARYKKQKRTLSFEKLFPDALEMLVGALRAGLALPGAIQVVADESPDPVGQEFAILSEESRLGLDTKEALKRMGERIDSAELHLFITAVIIQRGTGGNLVEILERTAAVIRDRFRILGDVRSLTAHGRLSGFILALLPLGMAGVIMVVAPEYLRGLLADPLGRHLIVAAIVLQVVGLLTMRRIINIKV
jgi:tight adherence protein B